VTDPRSVPSLIRSDGCFFSDLVAVRDRFVPEQVAAEFRGQIERAYAAGLRVTHLDGHMFCYEPSVSGPGLLEVARAVAERYALPMRCRAEPAHRGPENAARRGATGEPVAQMREANGKEYPAGHGGDAGRNRPAARHGPTKGRAGRRINRRW